MTSHLIEISDDLLRKARLFISQKNEGACERLTNILTDPLFPYDAISGIFLYSCSLGNDQAASIIYAFDPLSCNDVLGRALFSGISSGNIEVVQLILSVSPGIAKDTQYEGDSALTFAAGLRYPSRSILEKLLPKSDIYFTDPNGCDFSMIVSTQHPMLIDLCLKTIDLSRRNSSGWTALHCACAYGHLSVVEAIIDFHKPTIHLLSECSTLARHLNRSEIVNVLHNFGLASHESSLFNEDISIGEETEGKGRRRI